MGGRTQTGGSKNPWHSKMQFEARISSEDYWRENRPGGALNTEPVAAVPGASGLIAISIDNPEAVLPESMRSRRASTAPSGSGGSRRGGSIGSFNGSYRSETASARLSKGVFRCGSNNGSAEKSDPGNFLRVAGSNRGSGGGSAYDDSGLRLGSAGNVGGRPRPGSGSLTGRNIGSNGGSGNGGAAPAVATTDESRLMARIAEERQRTLEVRDVCQRLREELAHNPVANKIARQAAAARGEKVRPSE